MITRAILCISALVLGGCSDVKEQPGPAEAAEASQVASEGGESPAASAEAPAAASAEAPAVSAGPPAPSPKPDQNGVMIDKAEYGDDWPYTVESGRLYCDPPGSNVVMESGGTVYALNGRAMGNAAQRGYVNARESITPRDEYGYFTVGDSQKIISRGLSMCR